MILNNCKKKKVFKKHQYSQTFTVACYKRAKFSNKFSIKIFLSLIPFIPSSFSPKLSTSLCVCSLQNPELDIPTRLNFRMVSQWSNLTFVLYAIHHGPEIWNKPLRVTSVESQIQSTKTKQVIVSLNREDCPSQQESKKKIKPNVKKLARKSVIVFF